MKAFWLGSLLLLTGPCLAADQDLDKVNGSIRVDSGQSVGDVSTVNGSIRIADKATVRGVDTVNGSVSIGDDSTAEEIDNVNGSIVLGARTRVTGKVDSVNGAITLDDGADVGGAVANVNGKIRLQAAHVGGGIVTTNGDIEVGANSRVENGIRVHKPSGSWLSFGKKDVPRVVIGPGAVVQGTLKFDREVELHVSDKATIGEVIGAKAVRFSGDQPPG